MTVRRSIEQRRGCGYRQPGGLYLVSSTPAEECARLPRELNRCPTCDQGVKPTRGWTWIDPAPIFFPQNEPAPHGTEFHAECCPLAFPGRLGKRYGLLWIGEKFYPTPLDFTREADVLGISRRIPALPRGFIVGDYVLLAHRKACQWPVAHDAALGGEQLAYGPGIFSVWRPSRVEYVVRGDETEQELEEWTRRGVEPVEVVHAGEQYETREGSTDAGEKNEAHDHRDDVRGGADAR